MTPQSEIKISKDGKEYKTGKDLKGTSRRYYKRVCVSCETIDWLLPSKAKKKLCISCTRLLPVSKETKIKISTTLRRKYTDPDYKEKVLQALVPKRGEDHWNWKGGVSPVNQIERNSEKAITWRKQVFNRDSYTCRICESKGQLQAHHILPWATFPENRFDVGNGLTLCVDCHNKIHIYFKEINHYTAVK